DLIVDMTFQQAFEDPEQVIGRYPEHRGAEAAEWIEGDDGAIGRHLRRKPVDEMNLGRNGPDRALWTVPHGLDDEFGRAAQIGSLHDLKSAFRMGDDLARRIPFAERLDLRDGEPCMD